MQSNQEFINAIKNIYSKNERFLNLYQEIEKEIKENYSEIVTPGQNIFSSLSSMKRFENRKDLIVAIKNIRNILAHTKQVNGHDIISVNESLIFVLEQILKELKEPRFLEVDKRYKTVKVDSVISETFKFLKTRKFLPVLNSDKRVVGVLAAEFLPEILTDRKYSDTALIRDFLKYMNLDDYLFASPEIPRTELLDSIQQREITGKKTDGIVFTKDGKTNGIFMGFISRKNFQNIISQN